MSSDATSDGASSTGSAYSSCVGLVNGNAALGRDRVIPQVTSTLGLRRQLLRGVLGTSEFLGSVA